MKAKYLLFAAAALVGISALGAKKGFDLNEIIPQLQTTLKTIRKVNFSGSGINVVIDVTIKNPTNKALNFASAGAVTVKKLLVYDRNNNLVATAEPNINALSIPAGGSIVLENIPLSTNYGNILDTILGGFSTNPDDYTVVAEIGALGSSITV